VGHSEIVSILLTSGATNYGWEEEDEEEEEED
jgi:hypothetical protein